MSRPTVCAESRSSTPVMDPWRRTWMSPWPMAGSCALPGPPRSTTAQSPQLTRPGYTFVAGFLDMHAHPLDLKDPSDSLELMLANGITVFRQTAGSAKLLKQRPSPSASSRSARPWKPTVSSACPPSSLGTHVRAPPAELPVRAGMVRRRARRLPCAGRAFRLRPARHRTRAGAGRTRTEPDDGGPDALELDRLRDLGRPGSSGRHGW